MKIYKGQRNIAKWKAGHVVGTVHTAGGLRAAKGAVATMLDWVEIRLDQLPVIPKPSDIRAIQAPKILTARDASEGGARKWTRQERLTVLLPLLKEASAVDVEYSLQKDCGELLSRMQELNVSAIFSFHDFQGTPPTSRLLRLRDSAAKAGAHVFKAATSLQKPSDLIPLVQLLEKDSPIPVAAMGMGPLGRASRLFLAASGSVLNYGWLHRPQVPGQYPALLLRKRLEEIFNT